MVEETKKKEQVGWNLASDHSRRISNLMDKATNYYLKGDIGSWYWAVSAIRENINHDLREKEKEELDEMERECNRFHVHWDKYRQVLKVGGKAKEQYEKCKGFAAAVRKYQRLIMGFLNDGGYFPKKEDRTNIAY